MANETLVRDLTPDMFAITDLGQYFCVNNAQTGIATAAAVTAFSATNPFVNIFNSDAIGGKKLYLDFSTLINTNIGTGGADVQVAVTIDATDRYTSGGTVLTTSIVNPYMDGSNVSVAKVRAGNLTVAAATAAVRSIVGRRYMKNAIPVVGDEHTIKFGGVDAPNFIGLASLMTKTLINVPKVIIGPQESAFIYLWSTSQSGATSWAPELGWIER